MNGNIHLYHTFHTLCVNCKKLHPPRRSLAINTKNFELDEPRFEDEIYLPKLKFVLKAHGMDIRGLRRAGSVRSARLVPAGTGFRD